MVGRAWAKLDKSGRRHSLLAHSADVGATVEALLLTGNFGSRLAALAGVKGLNPVDVGRLSLLAALHDIGKANRGFQAAPDQPPGTPRAGHIKPVVDLLCAGDRAPAAGGPSNYSRLVEASGLDHAFRWWGRRKAAEPLISAVLMHHGRLPDARNPDGRLWREGDGNDPFAELDLIGRALPGWFEAAFSAERSDHLLTPRFLHGFAGLVMLADWIASDDLICDFVADAGAERIETSRRLAASALHRLRFDPRPASAALPPAGAATLTALLGPDRTPRAAQVALAATEAETGSLVVIEAETGSGKTEAALLHFADLLRLGLVDGLYFALPTRAAARQIHGRVVEAMARLMGDAAPPVVLALPGYPQADDATGVRLPGFEVLWPDDFADARRDAAWAAEHPKRFMAAAVAVGSIDQVMLGGLAVRHAELRSSPLLRQLLVIDEVHASDSYMTAIVTNLLAQHRAAGGHALLMSATLGTAARYRLMGRSQRDIRALPGADELAVQPYPAIHALNASVPPLPPPAGPGKTVAVECLDEADNAALARHAIEAARQGARVLVIRNRVDDAVETAQAVAEWADAAGQPALAFRCNGVATVHHGRFAPADRVLLDQALEAALGHDSTAAKVCVTTQTAEQSLDIDADYLITDLCPADVLLQRIGRLHRHARSTRPPAFAAPRALVLAPPEDRLAALIGRDGTVHGRLLGLGKVYENLLSLVATRRCLLELGTIAIPAHNRLLVERATHPPALRTLADSLGPPWQSHLQKVAGETYARQGVARLNMLDFDEPPQPLPDAEARILTRLGADALALEVDPSFTSVFGATIRQISIPGWMVKGERNELNNKSVHFSNEGMFSVWNEHFCYGPWGIGRQ